MLDAVMSHAPQFLQAHCQDAPSAPRCRAGGICDPRSLHRCRDWIAIALAILGLCCALAVHARGAPIPASATRDFHHFEIRQYTRDSGLPGDSGYQLLIDRDGVLWIGSTEGLIRYDGRRFELYDNRRVPALGTNEVQALAEDGRGGLLVGMAGGQLLAGQAGALQRIGFSLERPFAIRAAADGGVLTCTVSGVQHWISGQARDLVRLPDEARCFAIRQPRWLVMSKHSAVVLEGDQVLARRDDLALQDIRELRGHVDGDRVWLWDDTQLIEWMLGGTSTHHATPSALRRCNSLVRDAQGTRWCGANRPSGLARSSGDVRGMASVAGGIDHVLELTVDAAGGLWAWTWGHGLFRFEAGPARLIGREDGVHAVAFIRPGRDDSLLLVGRDAAWRWRNEGLQRIPSLPARPPDDRLLSYAELSDGTNLLGSVYGLYVLPPQPAAAWVQEASQKGQGVFALVAEGDRALIGSEAVLQWVPSAGVTVLQAQMPLVYDMVRDRAGRAYAATRDGIWRQTEGGGFVRIEEVPAPVDRAFIVMATLRDRRDHLWFGGYESGLWRYDGQRWLHLHTALGLPSDTGYGLVEDAAGRIWVSHGRGLYTLDPQAVDALQAGSEKRLRPLIHTRAHGLPSESFNGGSATPAWRDRDGSLWFASDEGAVQVDPGGWPRPTPAPRISLRALEIDGRAQSGTRAELQLPPGTRETRVQVQAPSLGTAERIELGWRLHPEERDFRALPDDGWIDLPRLAIGRQRLEVAARINGQWQAPWQLPIEQFAPWYLKPWAWTLGALLILATLAGLWRWRLLHLKARNQALEALVAERGTALAAEQNRSLQAELARREAERELHFRRLADARELWSQLDGSARVVLAAVLQSAQQGAADALESLAQLHQELGGFSTPIVDSALARLTESGLLGRDGTSWRLLRSELLLLPEIQRPIAQLAREQAQRVGAYRLLEVLGRGGYGDVYRAQNVHDGSPAAVKLLDADPLLRQDALRRLTREGEIVVQLRHPHIVRLLERGEHAGRVYLAMELIDGETLAKRLERGPLPPAECLRIARELASALAALHAAGVVHRDVNPNNIMLDRNGRSVLLDFGLARGHRHSTLTRPQTLLGTLPYMAPEQLRGDDAGPAADVWALGIVCAEMLTGRLPWRAEQSIEMAVEVGRYEGWHAYPKLSDPDWNARLQNWLAPQPGDRPQASEALAQLAAPMK